MKRIALVSFLTTLVFIVLYKLTESAIVLTFAITFGTIAYHFIMRLLVGGLFQLFMHNKTDYTKKWFQVGKSEMKLYQKLKVKKWKNKMPTYDAEIFDVKKHSWEEGFERTTQALDEAGIGYCAYSKVYNTTIKGVRITALGFDKWQNDQQGIVEAIQRERPNCDLLIVGGTSLVVYPAAGLIRYFQGRELVICNLQPTPQDASADLVCACDIAKAFAW